MTLQHGLLGLALLMLLFGGFLALLILIGLVGDGIESGFGMTDLVAMGLLLMPLGLIVWGVRLFLKMFDEFNQRMRRSLFAFHAVVLAYCGLWLVSTAKREGGEVLLFQPGLQLVGLMCLVFPLATLSATSSDSVSIDEQQKKDL